MTDLFTYMPYLPPLHETLLGTGFEVHPGGEELCQAFAAPRMDAEGIERSHVTADRAANESGVDEGDLRAATKRHLAFVRTQELAPPVGNL